MDRLLRYAKRLGKQFSGELKLAIFSTAFGVVVERILEKVAHQASFVNLVTWSLLAALFVAITGLSLMIKKNVAWIVARLASNFDKVMGSVLDSPFYKRMDHFREEKGLLARALVKQTTELMIGWSAEDPAIRSYALVVDSGTTLTPFLPEVKRNGFGRHNERVNGIYTNSLSGVEEFNRETGDDPYPVQSDKLHLLGGNPLDRYRATTGPHTVAELRRIPRASSSGKVLVVGFVTANWIIVTPDGDMILCAKGQGHYEFKEQLVEIADRLVVVAPLGKLLRYSSVDELNRVLREAGHGDGESYRGLSLSRRDRAHTYLFTTERVHESDLLYFHAAVLRSLPASRHYTPKMVRYELPRSLAQQREIEWPHEYIRADSEKAFVLGPKQLVSLNSRRAA